MCQSFLGVAVILPLVFRHAWTAENDPLQIFTEFGPLRATHGIGRVTRTPVVGGHRGAAPRGTQPGRSHCFISRVVFKCFQWQGPGKWIIVWLMNPMNYSYTCYIPGEALSTSINQIARQRVYLGFFLGVEWFGLIPSCDLFPKNWGLLKKKIMGECCDVAKT